ncbi:amidohydrolase family protein [Pendulispora rubella]|uniref:Amidohydrolase family protein n=1 Tax=Pendulispora rubella TaxID=2741070 RepID=A0ABZ2KUT5_9BACT
MQTWYFAAWAILAFGTMSAACTDTESTDGPGQTSAGLHEINDVPAGDPSKTLVITGATLIDGRGGQPVADAVVVVRGNRIVAAGAKQAVQAPAGAETVDAHGLTVLPGWVDAFFTIDGDNDLPALFLRHGITTVKDPGQWIEAYDVPRNSGVPIPRLFLTGPVLDSPPPAYPTDSYLVRDDDEAKLGVNRFVDQGASAIKAYYRLPLGLVRTVTQAAHARGVPVTAHLEIVDARDAIRAGVDGIDFATSFGTSLVPTREAEKYRQAVIADNGARAEGRYQVWSSVDLQSPRVNEVLDLAIAHGTTIVAALEPFERRQGDPNTTEMHLRGFQNMLKFVGLAHERGVRIAVGSHAKGPHSERGWGYQHELELLVESGLRPMDAIVAGTKRNAEFFRTSGRLGTIERDKLADLVFIEGDPLADIRVTRNVRRVMLNGRWIVEPTAPQANAQP